MRRKRVEVTAVKGKGDVEIGEEERSQTSVRRLTLCVCGEMGGSRAAVMIWCILGLTRQPRLAQKALGTLARKSRDGQLITLAHLFQLRNRTYTSHRTSKYLKFTNKSP